MQCQSTSLVVSSKGTDNYLLWLYADLMASLVLSKLTIKAAAH